MCKASNILEPSDGGSDQRLVRLFAAGDRLVNRYGERATVLEMLPIDPDYFARLTDDSDGEVFAATVENLSGWSKSLPNSQDQTPGIP